MESTTGEHGAGRPGSGHSSSSSRGSSPRAPRRIRTPDSDGNDDAAIQSQTSAPSEDAPSSSFILRKPINPTWGPAATPTVPNAYFDPPSIAKQFLPGQSVDPPTPPRPSITEQPEILRESAEPPDTTQQAVESPETPRRKRQKKDKAGAKDAGRNWKVHGYTSDPAARKGLSEPVNSGPYNSTFRASPTALPPTAPPTAPLPTAPSPTPPPKPNRNHHDIYGPAVPLPSLTCPISSSSTPALSNAPNSSAAGAIRSLASSMPASRSATPPVGRISAPRQMSVPEASGSGSGNPSGPVSVPAPAVYETRSTPRLQDLLNAEEMPKTDRRHAPPPQTEKPSAHTTPSLAHRSPPRRTVPTSPPYAAASPRYSPMHSSSSKKHSSPDRHPSSALHYDPTARTTPRLQTPKLHATSHPIQQLITLHIADDRYKDPQMAELIVHLRPGNDGGYWADAKEICNILQSGPGRIDGPAKASVFRGKFRQIFLRISSDNTDNVAYIQLAVPPSRILEVFVEPDLAPPPPPLIPLPMEGIVPPPVPRDLQVVANLPTPDGSDKVDLNPSDSYPRVPKRNNASLLTGVLDSPPPSAPQGRPSPTQEQRTAEWSSTQQHYPPASSKRRRKNEEPGASSDSRKPE